MTYFLAYQNSCALGCQGPPNYCGGDWANCTWSQSCSLDSGNPAWTWDPQVRKNSPITKPLHMGGQNLGFADGHAKWFESEAILFGGTAGEFVPAGNLFENVRNCHFQPNQ